MYYTLHAEDELTETLNEASTAYINEEYQTACNKYKLALELFASSNPNVKDDTQNTVEYILCIILLQSDTFHDIIEALKILINLEKNIGESYPAVYYAIAKAYIKLYRFNLAINTINKGLAILNEGTDFPIHHIPMTSTIINETKKEGLLISLMDLQEIASSWHCPNAKCFLEDCQDNIPHCSPCRDIFFSDPAFSGLVIITCSNASNPCKLNFHPVCWKFQKSKLYIENKLSDMDIIGHSCFTSNCGTIDRSVITKIEILNDEAKVVSVIENSSLSMLLVSSPPIHGAIKKYQMIKPSPINRRQNFLSLRTARQKCSKAFKEISEEEIKLMKLIQLRENNFGIPRENLELGKDVFNDEDINSTDILPECESENVDPETMQQCRFLSEIMYEFIKLNAVVHKNKLLSKWHETKEIMEYITKTDEYLDSDILNFLLKSPKLIRIGDYICVPQAIQQMFLLFEQEVIQQYKFVLQSESNEHEVTTSEDNENISHKDSATNNDRKTNQSPQKQSGLKKNVFESDDDYDDSDVDVDKEVYYINKTSESCESVTSSNSCSTNETDINTIFQSEDEFDLLKSDNESIGNNFVEDDDYQQPIFYREDKSFNYNNNITNKDDCTDIVHDDTLQYKTVHEHDSQSSIENPFLEDNMANNSVKNLFIQDFEQSENNDLPSPTSLEEKYKQLAKNYFVIVQNFAKLSKEKADIEDSFKIKLEKKDSIMKAFMEERKILIDKLNSYESNLSEKATNKYDASHANTSTLQTNIDRLKEEKKCSENTFKKLIEKQNTIEKIVQEDNIKLLKTIKNYEAEIINKDKELNILQDNEARLKKSILEKSLESQYYSNKNMLMSGIDYCNLSLDILHKLNSLIKLYTGTHIIPDYTEWSLKLNQFMKLFTEYEAEFLKCKSLLESKTEVEKLDEIKMSSINLPAYPNKSLSTTICETFTALITHITKMSAQNLPTTLHPLSNLEEFSNYDKILEESSTFTKQTEDESDSEKSDLSEENNEVVQCLLECIDNDKVGDSMLETNINKHKNQIDRIVEDVDNKTKTESAASKSVADDITNDNVPKQVDSIGQKKQKTEDITEENMNIGENNKENLVNSTDELMNILRRKYTGISDQSLSKSLNFLRKFHRRKSLTDIPLNIIFQDLDNYILSHQINH